MYATSSGNSLKPGGTLLTNGRVMVKEQALKQMKWNKEKKESKWYSVTRQMYNIQPCRIHSKVGQHKAQAVSL